MHLPLVLFKHTAHDAFMSIFSLCREGFEEVARLFLLHIFHIAPFDWLFHRCSNLAANAEALQKHKLNELLIASALAFSSLLGALLIEMAAAATLPVQSTVARKLAAGAMTRTQNPVIVTKMPFCAPW